MNTKGRMSFCNYVFPVNPSYIRIDTERSVSTHHIPFGNDRVFDTGKKKRVISGKGEVAGEDGISSLSELSELFDEGRSGVLYLPSQETMYVLPVYFRMFASDTEDVMGYEFRFVEEDSVTAADDVISDGKSSLWDYSYRYDIPIEQLVENNPQIRRPDIRITAGRRVKLC